MGKRLVTLKSNEIQQIPVYILISISSFKGFSLSISLPNQVPSLDRLIQMHVILGFRCGLGSGGLL